MDCLFRLINQKNSTQKIETEVNKQSKLLEPINHQLTEKGLKTEKASAVVVDATIIQTAGSKQRQAIATDDERQVSS